MVTVKDEKPKTRAASKTGKTIRTSGGRCPPNYVSVRRGGGKECVHKSEVTKVSGVSYAREEGATCGPGFHRDMNTRECVAIPAENKRIFEAERAVLEKFLAISSAYGYPQNSK